MLHLGSFLMSYSQIIGFILGLNGRYFSELVSSTNIANLFSQPCLCKYLQNDSTGHASGENQVEVNIALVCDQGNPAWQKKGSFHTARRSHHSSGTIFHPKYSLLSVR